MAQKISRREALKAAGAAACAAASPALFAQTPAPADKPPVSDEEMADVEKKLAKPLPEDAKKILKDDLSSQKSDTKKRLEVKLPENSEPCFIFVPTPYAPKPANGGGGMG